MVLALVVAATEVAVAAATTGVVPSSTTTLGQRVFTARPS
jgi:hypothetical protein